MSVQLRSRTDRPGRRVGKLVALGFSALAMALTTNIGSAAALTPNQTTMSGVVSYLNSDLNTFWWTTARAGGWTYTAPSRYYWFNGYGLPAAYNTACGRIDTSIGTSYCTANQEIYLDRDWLDARVRAGDYAGGVVLAHEWGHHIQWLKGHFQWAVRSSFFGGKELQADCYAGLYTRSLANRGLLAAGDVTEARNLLSTLGDPAGMSAYNVKSHGTAAQRVYWFNQGYNDYSVVKCDSVYTWLYG